MKAVFVLTMALLAPLPLLAALPVAKEPPALVYQIVSVQISGGAPDEQRATVMLEQQTGRSWMLVQRGSAAPVWQALTFESGFTLNQQTLPPDLSRLNERRERGEP